MNFEFVRGDDQILALAFTLDGVPKDITGWTIFFTVKKKVEDDDADAVIKKEITTHTDPMNGKTEIPILDTETDPLDGVYFYDVQYKDTLGIIKTVMLGTMSFLKDVTRRITA